MEIIWTKGICKESSLATRLHTNCLCPFCHTNFINQEEVIEHMAICSGTGAKPEVLKLVCPYCQPTFETYDKLDKQIQTHVMKYIRNLQNLSHQFQQPGSVNWSHKYLFMNRLWTSSAYANLSLLPAIFSNKLQSWGAH